MPARDSCALETDRCVLLVADAEVVPEELHWLSSKEHSKIYRMLQPEVRTDLEGYEVRGALCNSRPTGTRRFDGTKRTQLCFRALLTGGDALAIDWARRETGDAQGCASTVHALSQAPVARNFWKGAR